MERRPYFVLGDLGVNVIVGALAAVAARALVSPAWHPLLGMPAGMFAGTIVAVPLFMAFMPLLGALEVMLPAMLTGMLAGMVAGMVRTMHELALRDALTLGAVAGLLSIAWTYFLTARANRDERRGSTKRA